MRPTLGQQAGDGAFLFQCDGAPMFKARCIKTWLDESGVEELLGPAQSSTDPKPSEHLWDELKH